ncbi:hypothetical protein VTO42DRAFT_5717 [Malbranchea cinnamomea]
METSSQLDQMAYTINGENLSVAKPRAASLTALPSELLFQILSYLSPVDLASVSGTSRFLRDHANHDLLWADIVNANLPSPIRDPAPSPTFKDLYVSHHPLWFIVRNKIWFSDISNTGKIILARYNHKLGRIEAYRLVASHTIRQFQHWDHNPNVRVLSFDPQVTLWLDDPVVQLDKFVPSPQHNVLNWRSNEIRMPMALEAQRVFSTFILCSKMSPQQQNDPSRAVWPPRLIPAEDRVDITYSKFLSFQNLDDRPQRLEDICESAFRVRRWIQFGNHLASFNIGTVMDGISTFSTLRPELYTPTAEKPYQGIWVGDYSGHGSEFLLIIQRESPAERSNANESGQNQNHLDELEASDNAGGSRSSFSDNASEDELPFGGTLEAIKLTGDPNVPRGEISFVADDIGPRGLLRIADEELFKGVRVIRSRGHVAATNFRDDTFIPGQLFLISHGCLAHYWEELGHISYYRRVDIDKLLLDK